MSTEKVNVTAFFERFLSGEWLLAEVTPILFEQLGGIQLALRPQLISLASLLRYKRIQREEFELIRNSPELSCEHLFLNAVENVLQARALPLNSQQKQNIIEVRQIVSQQLPSLAVWLQSWGSESVYLPTADFRGGSHSHLFGLLVLGKDFFKLSKYEQALSIVHESAHQELFLVNLLDRLTLEGYERNLGYAPFQKKMRPPIARLHAAHSLFRMVQFAKKTHQDFSKLEEQFNAAAMALPNAEFTPVALRIKRELYAMDTSYLEPADVNSTSR